MSDKNVVGVCAYSQGVSMTTAAVPLERVSRTAIAKLNQLARKIFILKVVHVGLRNLTHTGAVN